MRGQEDAKIGRRDEFYSERGEAGVEDAALEGLDLTAGWNDDHRRAFASPSLRCGLAEPAFRRALPGGFCGCGRVSVFGGGEFAAALYPGGSGAACGVG